MSMIRSAKTTKRPVWVWITIAGTSLLAFCVGYNFYDNAQRAPDDSAPRTTFMIEGLDGPAWRSEQMVERINQLDGVLIESLSRKGGVVVLRHDPDRQDREALRVVFEELGLSVRKTESTKK